MKGFSPETWSILTTLMKVNPAAEQLLDSDQADLFEFGALDSLLIVEFVTALEQEYSFVFDLTDLTSAYFRNLAALGTLLRDKYRIRFSVPITSP